MFENFDWIGAMRSSPVMVVILICSVLTVGFALERLFYFTKRRGDPDTSLATALKAVRGGYREEALPVLSESRQPFGQVSAAFLVAVPAVMLYNHFVRQMGTLLTVAENHARTLRIESKHRNASRPSTRAA